jgi:hypothetical protein
VIEENSRTAIATTLSWKINYEKKSVLSGVGIILLSI